MATSEGYGQRLAERLRVEQAPAIAMRVLRTADMAVTETRCDDPVLGLSGSIQRADAFLKLCRKPKPSAGQKALEAKSPCRRITLRREWAATWLMAP